MSDIKSQYQRLLDPNTTFATLCQTLSLDPRIRKGIARNGFIRPTLVQSQALPLAIQNGRDLLVRARTGSGKTLSYVVPILQKVLHHKSNQEDETEKDMDKGEEYDPLVDFVQAVILVPTRELCQQVYKTVQELCFYCDDVIGTAILSSTKSSSNSKSKSTTQQQQEHESLQIATQEAMLRDRPDILVSTPAGLVHHLQTSHLRLKHSVHTFVIDEADLVLSFGYSRDIQTIVKALPTICQGFLLSATLSEELDQLKKIVLHSPAILKLEEEDELQLQNGKAVGSLMQFYLRLPKKDKFLVIYVFLKLGLLQGKGLFFVNSTDGGYRLKLFLEQFHIRSAVLNAELPARSRMSILDQFNAGNFDYLIATDESSYTTSHSKKHRKSQQEYGVSRGLDFRNVSFVLNVDMPASPESYTHRIGRTARGGAKGVALTLVTDESILTTKSGSLKTLGETKKQQAVVVKSTLQEDAVEEEGKLTDLELLEQIQGSQPPLTLYTSSAIQSNEEHSHLQTEAEPQQQEQQQQMQPCPLEFELKELEGFRYRVEDVSRAVTKTAVQETRAAELKAELLNSERLSAHFEINPTDLQILRHDRTATHVSMVQDHLKNVPSYMLPKGMQVAKMKKKRKRRNYNSNHNRRAMSASKSNDPLHSYDTSNNNTSNTSTTTTATTTSENDGYFGENPNTEEVPKKQTRGTKEQMYLSKNDRTGRSTSGRKAWQEKHSRGKFSKRYKNKSVEW